MLTTNREKHDALDNLILSNIDGAVDRWADDAPKHRFPRRFLNHAGFFAQYERPHAERRPLRTLKVAMIAAIIMSLSAVTIFSSDTFRASLVNVAQHVFPTHTEQHYTADEYDTRPMKEPVFGWLPEGVGEINRSITGNGNNLRILFGTNDTVIISATIVRAQPDTAFTVGFDSENAKMFLLSINGTDATVYEKDNAVTVQWAADNYFITLTGNDTTVKYMVKIAENLTLVSAE